MQTFSYQVRESLGIIMSLKLKYKNYIKSSSDVYFIFGRFANKCKYWLKPFSPYCIWSSFILFHQPVIRISGYWTNLLNDTGVVN